jgi:hypothetical protein
MTMPPPANFPSLSKRWALKLSSMTFCLELLISRPIFMKIFNFTNSIPIDIQFNFRIYRFGYCRNFVNYRRKPAVWANVNHPNQIEKVNRNFDIVVDTNGRNRLKERVSSVIKIVLIIRIKNWFFLKKGKLIYSKVKGAILLRNSIFTWHSSFYIQTDRAPSLTESNLNSEYNFPFEVFPFIV